MVSIYQRIGICFSLSLLFAAPVLAQEPKEGAKTTKPSSSYNSRSGALKEKLLRSEGGNNETEAAVARSLFWLAKQQKADGGWEFDGTYNLERVAATGMALLPFLGAGESHKGATKYKDTLNKGLKYLLAKQEKDGSWLALKKGDASDGPVMYVHALATLALCEAAGMTGDEKIKNAATIAVDYMINGQAKDGSWGYTSGTDGDTSITGWQIQALKSAMLADIAVNEKAFEKAGNFLDSVSGDSGRTYGYRTKGATHSLTAAALLGRQYMGWTPRNSALAGGIDFMWDKFPPKEDEWDIYYYYYATQVFHFFEGPKWHVNWNPLMRGILLKKQITEKTPGTKQSDIGSWPKDTQRIGISCGKLGTTALAVLTLEVYYRYQPLYKRDADGRFVIPDK